MKNIIQKAIEGGWDWRHIKTRDWRVEYNDDGGQSLMIPSLHPSITAHYPIKVIVCDPSFWQALGKACGWENTIVARKEYLVPIVAKDKGYQEVNHNLIPYPAWFWHARTFHEINLTEGWDKAVAYLEDLIK